MKQFQWDPELKGSVLLWAMIQVNLHRLCPWNLHLVFGDTSTGNMRLIRPVIVSIHACYWARACVFQIESDSALNLKTTFVIKDQRHSSMLCLWQPEFSLVTPTQVKLGFVNLLQKSISRWAIWDTLGSLRFIYLFLFMCAYTPARGSLRHIHTGACDHKGVWRAPRSAVPGRSCEQPRCWVQGQSDSELLRLSHLQLGVC